MLLFRFKEKQRKINKNRLAARKLAHFAGRDLFPALKEAFLWIDSPNYLSFLVTVQAEMEKLIQANQISYMPETLPFEPGDSESLLRSNAILSRILENETLPENAQAILTEGLSVIEKIERHYQDKLSVLHGRLGKRGEKLRLQSMQDEFDIKTGWQGILKAYDLLDKNPARDITLENGTVDFAAAASQHVRDGMLLGVLRTKPRRNWPTPPVQKSLEEGIIYEQGLINKGSVILKGLQIAVRNLRSIYIHMDWMEDPEPEMGQLYSFPGYA